MIYAAAYNFTTLTLPSLGYQKLWLQELNVFRLTLLIREQKYRSDPLTTQCNISPNGSNTQYIATFHPTAQTLDILQHFTQRLKHSIYCNISLNGSKTRYSKTFHLMAQKHDIVKHLLTIGIRHLKDRKISTDAEIYMLQTASGKVEQLQVWSICELG